MSTNFKIESRENKGKLYLDLAGDFDGNSAWELVNVIFQKHNGKDIIFVNTKKVKKVIPFGSVVLENLISTGIFPMNKLVFEDPDGSRTGSEGCKLLGGDKKGYYDYYSRFTSRSSITGPRNLEK